MRLGRYLSPMLAAALVGMGGVWLTLSPWLLGGLRPGGAWGGEALTETATGCGLVILAIAALWLYARSLNREWQLAFRASAPGSLPRRRTRRHPGLDRTAASAHHPRHAARPDAAARLEAPRPDAPAATAAAGPAQPGHQAADPGPRPGAGSAGDRDRMPPGSDADRTLEMLLPIATALLTEMLARDGKAPTGGPPVGEDAP